MAHLQKIIAFGLMFLIGCTGRDDLRDRVAGEWALAVSQGATDSARLPLGQVGVVVFAGDIPCYCNGISRPEEGAVIGRAFLDFHAIAPAYYPRQKDHFAGGRNADKRQEVVARRLQDGRLQIQTVGMSGLTFNGEFYDGGRSVRGTWAYDEHGRVAVEGSFVLTRASPTIYSDSARIRSRREVARWRGSGLPVE